MMWPRLWRRVRISSPWTGRDQGGFTSLRDKWPPPAAAPSGLTGFTIIEIIVVAFISTMVLAALLRFLSVGHPLAKTTYLQAQSTEAARLQLRRIATALREVQYSDAGAYPLVETGPQKLVFYANIDADTEIERVRYELSGTDLQRGVTQPSGNPITYDPSQEQARVVARLIRNGADPIFTYYTGDYPTNPSPLPGASMGSVKYIQFRLLIDADPSVDPPAVEVVSQVQLRNLKTNLGEGS